MWVYAKRIRHRRALWGCGGWLDIVRQRAYYGPRSSGFGPVVSGASSSQSASAKIRAAWASPGDRQGPAMMRGFCVLRTLHFRVCKSTPYALPVHKPAGPPVSGGFRPCGLTHRTPRPSGMIWKNGPAPFFLCPVHFFHLIPGREAAQRTPSGLAPRLSARHHPPKEGG